jgi:hypothetical protein
MKQCPNCRKTYGDDLFFCLDHGLPLVSVEPEVDPNALTDVNPDLRYDGRTERLVVPAAPTEVLPISQPTSARPLPITKKTSVLPYFLIAILLFVCVGLGAALLISNRDLLFGAANTNSQKPANQPTPVQTPANSARPSPSPATPSPTPARSATPQATVAIRGTWKGTWRTDSGTLFDFELRLDGLDDAALEGQIRWTMRRTARPDKEGKIGLSATEYVRGSFSEGDGSLSLKGYRKDDPDNVLVMLDEYRLKVSADGSRLTGLARNGGKWNGKVDLARGGSAAK